MKRSIFSIITTLCLVVFFRELLTADEWKPRHDLVSHTGVMNLTAPPPPEEVFFTGPTSPADASGWLEALKGWRKDRSTLLRYSGSQYQRPELQWTQRVFSQVQLLIWDRSFYDPEKGDYTVDRFLSETENRIGPIDAVLIWHVYPNLGVDDRNQFDMLRDLPGGIPGLRRVV
jgi:gamma-glutamyl hercynylcysteine S-oxide synthase